MHERKRNEDARDGDVIVNDSVASGRPDVPADRGRDRDRDIAIAADELGRDTLEEHQPPEKRD
jgi:hypothetical protein